jgi:tetratricopeptide (TPR) repeat protein
MSIGDSHSQMGHSVGAKIRAARQAKRYTQSQLAAPDFSVSYISAIERGQIHPSLRALEILARRLDLPSTQLLPQHSQDGSGGGASISGPMNEKTIVELALLEAQICILQGEAIQAIAKLGKLTDKYLQDWHRTQQRYLLGWAYLNTAQLQKCEDALIEAEKLATAQNDTYRRVHTYNLLGLAYAAMHNHHRALQSHQSCLELLESVQPQDPFFQCQVYNYLGQHYTHLDDFDSAIDMFKHAIVIAEDLVAPEHTQSVYWNLCQHYAEMKQYYLAALYSHKCLDSHVNTSLKSEIYYHLGGAILKAEPEKARAYLEEALQQENNAQDGLTQASITIRLAEWFLIHKQLEEAEQCARQAHELAMSFGNTIIAVEVLLTSGCIVYARGKYEGGDKHFVAGLDMLEQMQMYEELADQSASYAQLLDERGQAQEAITYYKRAFESRRRVGFQG